MKSIESGLVARRAADIESGSGSSESAECGDSDDEDEDDEEDEDVPSPKSKTLKKHTSPAMVKQGRVSQMREQFSNKPQPPAKPYTTTWR